MSGDAVALIARASYDAARSPAAAPGAPPCAADS
jgi:hypothetical protein